MRALTLVVVVGLTPATLAAQQEHAPVSPAAQAGLSVTPKWGQSKEVQQDYEQVCYDRARVQTGADPAWVAAADSAAAAEADSAGGVPPAGVINARRNARADRLQAGSLEKFRKAMTACLEGGGYDVE